MKVAVTVWGKLANIFMFPSSISAIKVGLTLEEQKVERKDIFLGDQGQTAPRNPFVVKTSSAILQAANPLLIASPPTQAPFHVRLGRYDQATIINENKAPDKELSEQLKSLGYLH